MKHATKVAWLASRALAVLRLSTLLGWLIAALSAARWLAARRWPARANGALVWRRPEGAT